MKIAIVSGKGGSGKSTVSAALIDLAEQVVAVDCDVDASNLPLLFTHEEETRENFVSGKHVAIDASLCTGCGRCVDNCAFGALHIDNNRVARSNDFLCEGCGLCLRLCPNRAISIEDEARSIIYTSRFPKGVLIHGDLCPGDDNSGKMVANLRAIADAEMEKRHILLQILDGPPGIGCPVLSTLTGMDRVVIVSEPTLSGISDLQRIYRVSSSFCKDIVVVINKCDINKDNNMAIHDLCNKLNLPVIAELPFDRQLVEAQLHCQSMVNYAPESACARELRRAFAEICTSSRIY